MLTRTVKIGQSVKDLPCKSKDQSAIPRTYVKSQRGWCSLGYLHSEFQESERPISKIKQDPKMGVGDWVRRQYLKTTA